MRSSTHLPLLLPANPSRHWYWCLGCVEVGVGWTSIARHYAFEVGSLPAPPAVQQLTRFELVIDLKTAKVPAIEMPANLLARAYRVIEWTEASDKP
jgi:hypothetical protein